MIDLSNIKTETNPMKRMKEIRDSFNKISNFLFLSHPEKMSVLFDGKDDCVPSVKRAIAFMKTGIMENEGDKARYILSIIFVLNSLESQFGNILWRAYFRPAHDNNWRAHFSKSSYYRIKYRAVCKFLDTLFATL